jgi:hypothetical protein
VNVQIACISTAKPFKTWGIIGGGLATSKLDVSPAFEQREQINGFVVPLRS